MLPQPPYFCILTGQCCWPHFFFDQSTNSFLPIVGKPNKARTLTRGSLWLFQASREKGSRQMQRALWVCRNCDFSWWTDGKSLIDIINATQTQGCPKQCSGVSNRIYIAEYETHTDQTAALRPSGDSTFRL